MVVTKTLDIAERVQRLSRTLREHIPSVERLLEPAQSSDDDPAALRAALDELRVEHEELVVAEEELRSQVDELARVNAVLSFERERYRELFDRASDALLVTNRVGLIHFANAAAGELMGAPTASLRGKPLAIFIDRDDGVRFRRALLDLDRTPRVTLEAAMKGRRESAVSLTLTATLTHAGERVSWILRPPSNLGDGGGAEPESRDLRDARELLERERTLRERAERAERAKDHFIGVLSHDLRAPINAVLGWTQLLRRELLDSKSREKALVTIERNARAQLTLVEELLDLSRIGADKVQLHLVALDLASVVRAAVEAMAPAALAGGKSLSCEIEPGTHVVFADRSRIQQILTNLLSNAMKFTPEGGSIIVELGREGRFVHLAVRDTGRGIAPDALASIFDRFSQEDATTAKSGIGLGLFIVRQLVELHGGSVTAHSAGPGHGARFVVCLPLPRSDALPEPEASSSLVSDRELEGLRILVVDDEDDARDVLAAILHARGATVASAPDARTALAMLDAAAPDVVVSDIGMPDTDGYAFVRQLRVHGDVCAIAVSGFTGEADVERARAAGYDAHVAKPLDVTRLTETIQDALARRR